MLRPHAPLLLSTALLLAACSGESAAGDTGAADTGAPADGTPADGAPADGAPVDGAKPPDAGTPTPGDAGTTQPDAGATPLDAHVHPAPDSGTPPRPDAGFGANVIRNGSFEQWANDLPVGWLGLQSNLPSDAIAEAAPPAAEGQRACQLTNSGGTHRRFTTEPTSLRAGRYLCTYAVRGHGEIRNAFYDTDFSSYQPSGYHAVDSATWERIDYDFNLADDVADTFELVFSLRNTAADRDHLQIDDVVCQRAASPCDALSCDPWARCDSRTVTCEPLFGRCIDDGDCPTWEACDPTGHRCAPRAGRCNATADCQATPATPVCERGSHTCSPGDPCAGVNCTGWQTCSPATGTCVMAAGRCNTTADCTGALPACDGSTRTCVAADAAVNIVPNGDFEDWAEVDVPYEGRHLLPEHWYGLDIPGSSELDPASITPYESSTHGGTRACRLVQPGQAERFTTEAIDVPGGSYTCAYWVRGHGVLRHRTYSSAGWSPYTDFVTVDWTDWRPYTFRLTGNVRAWRLIFYPGSTLPDRDDLQIDDVVCTRDAPP